LLSIFAGFTQVLRGAAAAATQLRSGTSVADQQLAVFTRETFVIGSRSATRPPVRVISGSIHRRAAACARVQRS